MRVTVGPCLLAVLCGLLSSPGFAAGIGVTIHGADGGPLKDAVVYAVPANGGTLPAPRNAEIDQRNKMFFPEVSVIQTGAAVSFPNSDNIRHQVYSFSPAKVFNTKLYSGRPADPVIFDKPGIVVLGCNIHDKMTAWVVVVDTPWFTLTDVQGSASLNDLPPGDYLLNYWHAAMPGDPLTKQVKLAPEGRHQETLKLAVTGMPEDDHAAHHGAGSP